MTDLAFLPAHELARRIARREISALELLDHHLARVARLDGAINAVPVLDAERARQRAGAADAALARGEHWGPLHGVPMTVKEAFNITGLPTTYGFEAFKDNLATSDALTVQRLHAAGAVIFGKTNVPTSLADWQSFNPVYGTTHNPWDLARTPGGSSGGSAAALAAGFAALELGSDIGASIRNPAHYCGVWGLKPTWGVVPQVGHELVSKAAVDEFDIAVAGPMARSAFDLEIALEVLTAPLTAMTPLGRVPMQWRTRGTPPRRCRVAIQYNDDEAPVDDEVQRALQRLADFLRHEGVTVTEGAKPVASAEAHAVYLHLLRAAVGAHYDDANHAAAVQRARSFAADDHSYPARHFRGLASSHLEWGRMNERREHLRRQWAAFFEQHDLLICPVATAPAFLHNQQGERWERLIPINDGQQPTTTALYWAGYPGLVGVPACAVPLGLSEGTGAYPAGLPVGAQICGPHFGDIDVLRFAQWLESAYRRFVPPPLATGLASA
jgi:amidase